MSLNFCHISPTKYLDIFATGRKCHLLLAHLINEDYDYLTWYQQERDKTQCKLILDNSAFEMFKREEPMYSTDKLLDAANKIRADYVVMTDYPNEEYDKTIDKAKDMGPKLLEHGYYPFFCPQSKKGDLDGLIKSYLWAAKDHRTKMIGFSILAIPNAYEVLDDPLQRFLSRWKFCQELEKAGFFHLIEGNEHKKLHMLGMLDGPNEMLLMKDYIQHFSSWDSSAAVWAGLNGIGFDNSPTGLINGKFEGEVDFKHDSATVDQISVATKNLKYINRLARNYEN